VTSIGEWAFSFCSNLTLVSDLNPEPQNISNGVFSNVDCSELKFIIIIFVS
jgi:hypothetical protein